jgi:hypothetical protein
VAGKRDDEHRAIGLLERGVNVRPQARRVTSTGNPTSCFEYGSCREMTKFYRIFLI